MIYLYTQKYAWHLGLFCFCQVLQGAGQVIQQVGGLPPQQPVVQQQVPTTTALQGQTFQQQSQSMASLLPQHHSKENLPATQERFPAAGAGMAASQQDVLTASVLAGNAAASAVNASSSRQGVFGGSSHSMKSPTDQNNSGEPPARVFDSLAASELIKSMAQGGSPVTVTTTATASQFQSQTLRERTGFFEQAEKMLPSMKTPEMPQMASSLKLPQESPLVQAALHSSPVVSLERLKPVQINPGHMEGFHQSSTPRNTQHVLHTASRATEESKPAFSEEDIKRQLLEGSPHKGGQILGPVLKKLSHAEMIQLLTSKGISPPSVTGTSVEPFHQNADL